MPKRLFSLMLLLLPLIAKADGLNAIGDAYADMFLLVIWLVANLIFGIYFMFRTRKESGPKIIRLIINCSMAIYATPGILNLDASQVTYWAIFAIILIALIITDVLAIYKAWKEKRKRS